MSKFSYFVFHVHSTSSSISLANCRLGEMFPFSFEVYFNFLLVNFFMCNKVVVVVLEIHVDQQEDLMRLTAGHKCLEDYQNTEQNCVI